MFTLVLLVLALVWGVLLVSWLRSRTGNPLSDSVGTFRRHLSVLEKAAPSRVAPANRLYERSIPPYRSTRPVSGTRIGAPARPPVRRVPNQAALRRKAVQKRRRDVFFALVAGTVGSFLLAVAGLSVLWSVQVLFDILLFGYVALLVRIRNLAAERELKLYRLPQQGQRVAHRPRPTYDLAAGYGDLDLRRIAN